MAVPDFQSFMLPIMQLTGDKAEHSLGEVIEKLADEFHLTEDERRELLPSGRQARLDNRVGWAVTYLRKTGLLERTGRGRFRITESGLKVLSQKPSEINMKFLEQFEGFHEFRKRREASENDYEESETEVAENSSQTPDEAIEAAYQRIRANLAQELLERVRKVEPKFFETLVVDLLMAMGYGGSRVDAGQIVGKVGDGGIDGIINEDKLGLDVVYIQAKRWENRNIGGPELREFVGALSGRKANKGVYITTSTFTDDARAYVRDVPQKIVLIDGQQLAQLMIDYEVGVSTAQKYEVKKIDLDYFEGI